MAVQISGNDITVPRDGTFTRNVTIGGTLTYEDVTNIDSVGLITARTGIEIGARPGVAASISVDGNMIVSGISTFGGAANFAAISGTTGTFSSNVDVAGELTVAETIAHTGDTNNKISFPAADTFAVTTSGSEALRVDSGGRLLVGTNSARTFGGGVYAHLQLEGTTQQGSQFTVTRNSNDTYSPNISLVKTRGTSDGAVTTVQDNDSLGTIQFRGADGSDVFAVAASITGEVDGSPSDGTDMPGALTFATTADGAASPTERARITSAGLFGIGTNAPDARLYVNGVSTANVITARAADSNGNSIINILSEGTTGNSRINFSDTAGTDGQISYSHSARALTFASGGTTERMRLDSAGRLQHGHTSSIVGGKIEVHAASPETQITINESSDSGTGPALYINRTRGSDLSSPSPIESNNYIGSIHFGSYDTSSYEKGASIICVAHGQTWGNSDCPSRLTFLTTPDNSQTPTEKLRILPDGHIFTNGLDGGTDITTTGTGDTYDGMQIGKPPLRVTRTSGCPVFLNRNGSGGNIQEWRYGGSIVGYVSNTGNSLPSDRNYKKNITNLSLGLDLVNKLQPVSYHYKFDADSDPVMYGLVAQDVKTALNDAGVAQNTAAILQYEEKNDEKDSDYSLDYTKLTPILINAVKELSTEIESLKSEIAALKSS